MTTPTLSLPIITILILTTFTLPSAQSAAHHAAAAPSPSVDCSSLVMNMADCLSFVSNGSTVKKPEKTCCSGLKTVLKTDPQCLCEAFKSSASLGVVLNVTKAMSLPSACKMSNVAAPKCGLSLAPGMAPAAAMAPTASASLPPGAAMAPTTGLGGNAMAPSPTPGSSGTSKLEISISSLIFGLMLVVIASSSSF